MSSQPKYSLSNLKAAQKRCLLECNLKFLKPSVPIIHNLREVYSSKASMANIIGTIRVAIAKLCWYKALSLDFGSDVTNFNQL